MKKNKNAGGIVYSTNPDFSNEESGSEESLPAEQQLLKIRLDKKQRAGKTVTLIEGFEQSEKGTEQICKQLKSLCGTGGSAKNSEIIIQGDHREKIFVWLQKQGYSKAKKI